MTQHGQDASTPWAVPQTIIVGEEIGAEAVGIKEVAEFSAADATNRGDQHI